MRLVMLLLALVSLLGESSYARRNYANTRAHSHYRRYRVECAHPSASCVGQTNELYCMACTISGEARGNTERAQFNVGQAMIARMFHVGYPTNLCAIANQGHGVQFAGRHGDHGYVCPAQVAMARKVLAMDKSRIDKDSTNFHARYVHPRWHLRSTKHDDAHLYFSDGSRRKPGMEQRYADLQHIFGLDRERVASYDTSVAQ